MPAFSIPEIAHDHARALLTRPFHFGASLLFASCKSNDITSSNNNSNTTNVGLPCHPEAGTVGGQCGTDGVCLAGFCRKLCSSHADCVEDSGAGLACLTAGALSGCQLASELTCGQGHPDCPTEFTCGSDHACHTTCVIGSGCPVAGDTCGPPGACYRPGTSGGSDGGGGGQDATNGPADSAAPDGTTTTTADAAPDATVTPVGDGGVTPCPTPQTTFGNISQGDSNANFTSGVGVRTANKLLIFSGYSEVPDAGDGGVVNSIWVQAFDPATAQSLGPAQLLFAPSSTAQGSILLSAAIAPTGQIALLYGGYFQPAVAFQNVIGFTGLEAAFLGSSPNGGPSGVQLQRTVQLEVDHIYAGLPEIVWSNSSGNFVISWPKTSTSTVNVRRFSLDGHAAGGDTVPVPTDSTFSVVNNIGNIAPVGNLLAVSYDGQGSNRYPYLTILDALGNAVGAPILLTPASGYWVAVGGAASGFVALYDDMSRGVGELFVPFMGDAGVADGGDAGPYSGFHFPGTQTAMLGRTVNDDTGGVGGIGAALIYSDHVAFAYVKADGLASAGATSVFSHPLAGINSDIVNITNFGGSFGLSLYDSTKHATQMAASGCN